MLGRGRFFRRAGARRRGGRGARPGGGGCSRRPTRPWVCWRPASKRFLRYRSARIIVPSIMVKVQAPTTTTTASMPRITAMAVSSQPSPVLWASSNQVMPARHRALWAAKRRRNQPSDDPPRSVAASVRLFNVGGIVPQRARRGRGILGERGVRHTGGGRYPGGGGWVPAGAREPFGGLRAGSSAGSGQALRQAQGRLYGYGGLGQEAPLWRLRRLWRRSSWCRR